MKDSIEIEVTIPLDHVSFAPQRRLSTKFIYRDIDGQLATIAFVNDPSQECYVFTMLLSGKDASAAVGNDDLQTLHQIAIARAIANEDNVRGFPYQQLLNIYNKNLPPDHHPAVSIEGVPSDFIEALITIRAIDIWASQKG